MKCIKSFKRFFPMQTPSPKWMKYSKNASPPGHWCLALVIKIPAWVHVNFARISEPNCVSFIAFSALRQCNAVVRCRIFSTFIIPRRLCLGRRCICGAKCIPTVHQRELKRRAAFSFCESHRIHTEQLVQKKRGLCGCMNENWMHVTPANGVVDYARLDLTSPACASSITLHFLIDALSITAERGHIASSHQRPTIMHTWVRGWWMESTAAWTPHIWTLRREQNINILLALSLLLFKHAHIWMFLF